MLDPGSTGPVIDQAAIGSLILQIERLRNSRTIVLAASNLDIDLLGPLYDSLREFRTQPGRSDRLDVVIYCRGGIVNAARRIALLLNEFTDHLAFIVPDRCESSGTITILSGREIIAGPCAIFSPVDPILQSASPESGSERNAISAQDVRLFGQMASHWFGLTDPDASAKALTMLCESIFPTTLTSFYRSTLEVEQICRQLLSLNPSGSDTFDVNAVVEKLLYGYHSHSYALGPDDLFSLGLPVRRDAVVEAAAWEMANLLRTWIGGAARQQEDAPRIDTIIASSQYVRWRRRDPGSPSPRWQVEQVNT
jgi:hypothetical protein